MRLKSLEINGFKSFARKCLLEFKSPITAVVGPNGSGKSNITEAFRFVLGEQSMKSLRGQRGQDLIWSGSPALPRGHQASVRIIFDNRGRWFNWDFDELVIERRVFGDGINEYLLNGNQVRLKDILEILAPANVGVSGHQIISQGQADQVLNAAPAERREMIEDALGLRAYHLKNRESRRKLEKTEANVERVESLRRELWPHVKFLKRQYDKLQRGRELRDELFKQYREYFSAESRLIDSEQKSIAGEKIQPAAELSALRQELKQSAEKLKEGPPDENKDRLRQLETNWRSAGEEKEKLTRDLGRLEGQENYLLKTLERQQAETGKNLPVDRGQLESLSAELSGEWPAIERSQDSEFLKNILRKFLSRLEAVLKIPAAGDAERKMLAELEEIRGKKAEQAGRLAAIEERERDLSFQFRELQQRIESEKDSNRDLENKIFRLKAQESQLAAKLLHLADRERQLERRRADFEQELKEAKALVGEAVGEQLSSTPPAESELPAERFKKLERLKIRLEEAGGIGAEVEREYREISERDSFLERELEDLRQSAESLKRLIGDLEKELDRSFQSGLKKINQSFQSLIAVMFGGGTASLTLFKEKPKLNQQSEEEPETEESLAESRAGLDVKISLPRKKIRNLEMLSGGERALVSIALIFAISQVNPPPFLVLDETDAALDEANSKRYGDMLESLADSCQLALITHNRETMSRAGLLYGVTMGTEGYSRVLSVDFEQAISVAK